MILGDQNKLSKSITAHRERKIITIAVVAHKPYKMPEDPMYMPLHVGAALHPEVLSDWVQDNTGDNMSSKNAKYSELTGLYWLWHNDDSEYQGIVHYRRYFGTANFLERFTHRDRFDRIVGSAEIANLIKKFDIVLPCRRNYYIETIYSHYIHTFPAEHLVAMREIIGTQEKEYLHSFDLVMNSRSAHMFNMFIMSREKICEYCSWLFPLLDCLERRINDENYSNFDKRYLGRISEVLLDVWIKTKGYRYAELPVVNAASVNWIKKGGSFLMAKFINKKYKKSF